MEEKKNMGEGFEIMNKGEERIWIIMKWWIEGGIEKRMMWK